MYTTEANVKRRIDTGDLTTSQIEAYIEEATAWIESETSTKFDVSTATSRIYSTPTLSSVVVIDMAFDITAVEILQSRTVEGDTWQIVEPLSYRLEPENYPRKRMIQFTDGLGIGYPIWFEGGRANVRVTGKFGYSATVPKDIERIATSYVIEMMRVDGTVSDRVSSEKLGDASFSYSTMSADKVLHDLRRQLRRYSDIGDIRI